MTRPAQIELRFAQRSDRRYQIPDRCKLTITELWPIRLWLAGSVCDGTGQRVNDTNGFPMFVDGILDTGSPISFFPIRMWSSFQEHIRWWPDGCTEEAPDWVKGTSGWGGKGVDCRVGEVQVQFNDGYFRVLPPVVLLGKFAISDGPIQDIVFGLGGGQFEGCRLEVDFLARKAWLGLATTEG